MLFLNDLLGFILLRLTHFGINCIDRNRYQVETSSMGDKALPLCKWRRRKFEENLDELKEVVSDPRFVCTRCGRAAVKKKFLCKPVKLKDEE